MGVYGNQVPFQMVFIVEGLAVTIQYEGVCLENDDIITHYSSKHNYHLQLIVYPQEHGAWDQSQNAAVDKILPGQRQPVRFTSVHSSGTFSLIEKRTMNFQYLNAKNLIVEYYLNKH